MTNPTNCPKCGADFQGTPIPEKDRHHFGNKTHFSRLIGIEIPSRYDGVSVWQCPDCGHQWPRFTS